MLSAILVKKSLNKLETNFGSEVTELSVSSAISGLEFDFEDISSLTPDHSNIGGIVSENFWSSGFFYSV